MQKLWAKKHPSEAKGTKRKTSVSCNCPMKCIKLTLKAIHSKQKLIGLIIETNYN